MIAIELVIIIAACTFLAGYAANYALNYMKTHPKVEENGITSRDRRGCL